MTVHRIRFEGPRDLAVRVARDIADVDGVDLVASAPPEVLGPDSVALEVSVEAERAVVADALVKIRRDLMGRATVRLIDS